VTSATWLPWPWPLPKRGDYMYVELPTKPAPVLVSELRTCGEGDGCRRALREQGLTPKLPVTAASPTRKLTPYQRWHISRQGTHPQKGPFVVSRQASQATGRPEASVSACACAPVAACAGMRVCACTRGSRVGTGSTMGLSSGTLMVTGHICGA
jgi:hypothetical protein